MNSGSAASSSWKSVVFTANVADGDADADVVVFAVCVMLVVGVCDWVTCDSVGEGKIEIETVLVMDCESDVDKVRRAVRVVEPDVDSVDEAVVGSDIVELSENVEVAASVAVADVDAESVDDADNVPVSVVVREPDTEWVLVGVVDSVVVSVIGSVKVCVRVAVVWWVDDADAFIEAETVVVTVEYTVRETVADSVEQTQLGKYPIGRV